MNALAELHRKDRRTIKRAILEAGLVPVCHEGGHPRYDLGQAEEAIIEYEASKLPPWNPSPEEARQRLGDLCMKLLEELLVAQSKLEEAKR